MQVQDALIRAIVEMIKSTPNDQELGKKVRALLSPTMYEQGQTSKNILKG